MFCVVSHGLCLAEKNLVDSVIQMSSATTCVWFQYPLKTDHAGMKCKSEKNLTAAHNWGQQPRKNSPANQLKDVDCYVKAALSNIDDLPVHRDPEELPEPIASWRALARWLG